MARQVMEVRYATTCADCGTALPAGTRGRYYGPRKMYGVDCHSRNGNGQKGGRIEDTVREAITPKGDGHRPNSPKPKRNGAQLSRQRTVEHTSVVTSSGSYISGGQWLVPGKDHRRTAGKATFSGKGIAMTCKSIAYWDRPIHRLLTLTELTLCDTFTQLLQNLGRRHYGGDPPSVETIFRPAVFMPAWVPYVTHFAHRINPASPFCGQCTRDRALEKERVA